VADFGGQAEHAADEQTFTAGLGRTTDPLVGVHADGPETSRYSTIITGLRARGYPLVTLSEFLTPRPQ
jgi:hypothetical protein